ncbi:uncharacterized protein EI90DRAFT_321232 [Cantharellus anzutake]|uniref:uncharacterized protein n=1 Tax=Cantharellus anzutake TaxID=1750568 RepID=UPI0019076C39|nr:uncharacterized protein EI90DRAFT_321232 [Cantharellus anzutake]KAF8335357.1 hypothetical protein EI90DRAFT_321232 [Cantharellus anzutake]
MSMTEQTKISENKDRMSKALGAAFLGHQVEQLENRAFTGASGRGGRGRGGRGRPWAGPDSQARGSAGNPVARSNVRGGGSSGVPVLIPPKEHAQVGRKRSFTLHPDPDAKPIVPRERERTAMANIIILDASILVHALGQVKRWCKEERKEILVIPLEALNTLDLLKKGGSTIAIHARAASRFLEAQVGTNPRIRVQGDEQFIPWDDLYSRATGASSEQATTDTPGDFALPSQEHAPEWMRQIVCCTGWETLAASAPLPEGGPAHHKKPNRVALAIIKPNLSPAALETQDSSVIKHLPRTTGDLLRLWAPKLGLNLLQIDQGASERQESRGDRHKSSTSEYGGHHRRGGRSSADESRGLVEKVKNGLNTNSPVAIGGAAKIRLLARGEKLDP